MKTTEDPRIKEFARILVERGAEVEEGDYVYLLSKSLESLPLFEEVRRQIIKKGAYPHEHLLYDSQIGSEGMDHDWMNYSSKEQLKNVSEAKRKEMKNMDCYIRIGGPDNTQELSGIDSEKSSIRKKSNREIMNIRFDLKWAATRFPTDGMAQNAGMPTSELEEMVIKGVTDVNYDELEQKNQRVKKKFDGAEEVKITGKETEITFSLIDREGISSSGKRNFPDGEVFYAPVKDSVNGKIKFSYPSTLSGNEVQGIKIWLEDGKIVEYEADKNREFLADMIGADEGSKYLGEFGIGTNRKITEYINSTIPDEKIGGTVHFAIGNAYEECVPEGEERNQSGIHWDIVKDLRPRAGGGKIIVDGEVIQEDGEWQFEV